MKLRSMLVATIAPLMGLAFYATSPASAAPVQPNALVTYMVQLKTGDVADAGTNSTVYIRLLGTLGTTDYLLLDSSRNDRERGQLDTYGPFYLSDLGDIWQVRIAFYPAGDDPDWYLDYATVDPSNRPLRYFPCYCWFSGTSNKHLDPA